jgi:methyl-accepting chemotaxis protein
MEGPLDLGGTYVTPSPRQTLYDTLKLLAILLAIEAAAVIYSIYTLGLYRDDRWLYFVMFNSIAAVPVVGIIIVYCLRWARGVIEFNAALAQGREATPEQARQAIASIFAFARNGALLLAALYTVTTMVFALVFFLRFDFSALEALIFFAFKSFSGINLSIIFYYTIKAVERPYLGNAVSRLMREGEYAFTHFRFSIKYKIFLVIFSVAAYLIFAALLMGFNQVESAQLLSLEENMKFWRDSAAAPIAGAEGLSLSETGKRLGPDTSLLLLGKEGAMLQGNREELSREELRQIITGPEQGEIKDYRKKRLVLYRRLPQGDSIVLVGRFRKFANAEAAAGSVMLALFFAAIILTLAATWMLVGDINTPLKGILEFLHRVSRGERGIILREYSEDELGIFVRDLVRTTSLLEQRTRRADDLVLSIQEIAAVVGNSLEKVKAATDEQAQGVDIQDDAVEQAGAVSREILKMSGQISDLAREVRGSAELNLKSCREGDARVALALAGFKEMGQYVEDISGNVLDLGRHIARISSIVEIIEEISDQIGLLSLNAELEAAGAGEIGARFLAVAQEVRRLSDRTMEVVNQIARLVDSTVTSSDRAVESARKGLELVTNSSKLADAIGETIGEIKEQAGLTETAARNIASASGRQDEESEKLKSSILHVDATARQIKENTARVRQAMDELSLSADKLMEKVHGSGQD